MILFDLTNVWAILFALFVLLVLLVIAKVSKSSIIATIDLFLFLALIIIHVLQFATVGPELVKSLAMCIAYDFALIFVAFVGYLWVDDIAAKEKNRKSIDNSLDWFWNKL